MTALPPYIIRACNLYYPYKYTYHMLNNGTFNFHDILRWLYEPQGTCKTHTCAPLKVQLLVSMTLHGPRQANDPQCLYTSPPQTGVYD